MSKEKMEIDETDDVDLLDFDFGDAVELYTLPDGENQLRVVNVEKRTKEETGNTFLLVRLESVDDPHSKDITHVIMYPSSEKDEKENNNRKLRFKQFIESLGVDSTGMTVDDLIGETCWAILGTKDSPEYGEQNTVRRFIVGN